MVAIKSLLFFLPVFVYIASASPINLETIDVYARDNALITRSVVVQLVHEAPRTIQSKDTPEATPVRCRSHSMS